MEAVLSFFSDMILFTAGLFVVVFWILIMLVVVDEIIDLIAPNRNKSKEDSNE